MTLRAVTSYVVGAFRADAARARVGVEIRQLVEELSASNPEFKAMWDDNEISSTCGGIKSLHHRILGGIALDLRGRRPSDLNMMVSRSGKLEVKEQSRSLIASAC
jgi:hypothetical protein